MMKNLFLATGLLFSGITAFAQTCPEPFFSEYIEGSSSNKAMEIYNPGNVAIDLENYVVYRFNNGSVTASDSLFPIGILAAHDVFVFGNPSAVSEILDVSDTLHTLTFYNGDDAILLINRISGDTLDALGVVGEDPGTNWPVGTGATSEYTLVRKMEVTSGTTDWAVGATQWDVYPQNTIDSLGMHTANAIDVITADYTYATSDLVVDFTNVSLGITDTYTWDFGDGTISTAENPTHSFPGEGDYTVCLIADGPCDAADTICMIVNICPLPEAAYSFILDGLMIGFTNETILDGDSFFWDFGDGAISLEENPEHTYVAEGDYTVCFVVTNGCGSDSTCMTVSTCLAPEANFSSNADGLTVDFTNESLLSDDQIWDFGDGTTSTDTDPSHTYISPGESTDEYNVCLTALSGCGEDVSCYTIIICDSFFLGAAIAPSVSGLDVVFYGDYTGTIETYHWDFGDGTTSSDEIFSSHTYAEDGEYIVCLTVTDPCGNEFVTCDTVVINTASIPVYDLNKVSVYPNPFNESFILNFGVTLDHVGIVITDINGRVIETLVVNQSATLTLDLAVEAGVYFVQMTAGSETQMIRVIKK